MKKTIIYLLLCLVLVACGASVDGEKQKYAEYEQYSDMIMNKYPQFASQVELERNMAEKKYNDAIKVKDDDKKIAALENANRVFENGFVGNYKKFETATYDLENQIKETDRQISDKDFTRKTSQLIDDAKETLKDSENLLKDATTANSGLILSLEREIKNLNDAKGNLEAHVKSINAKNTKKKDKKDEKIDNSSDEPTLADEPAQIKCKRCGTMQTADSETCSSCGAQI